MTSSITGMPRPGATPPRSAGLAGVATAFKRALVSQFHPAMIGAGLLPFLIIFVGAALLLWFFWTPLTDWLRALVSQWSFFRDIDQSMIALGLFSIKLYLVPILAMAILLPISGILGLGVAAVFVMPLVLSHVHKNNYPDLVPQGRFSTAVSTWNAVWVMMVFALGWVLTLPLWLVPPLALLLSVLWWTFAFSRMMRVDAIVEHASTAERKFLLERNNRGFWMIGLICALINMIPPAWVFLPVFSALVFGHYGLNALREIRQNDTVMIADRAEI